MKGEVPNEQADGAVPPEPQVSATIGPIFEVIPIATQAKDLLKAQFLEPLGKRENFANSIRTQNRR